MPWLNLEEDLAEEFKSFAEGFQKGQVLDLGKHCLTIGSLAVTRPKKPKWKPKPRAWVEKPPVHKAKEVFQFQSSEMNAKEKKKRLARLESARYRRGQQRLAKALEKEENT